MPLTEEVSDQNVSEEDLSVLEGRKILVCEDHLLNQEIIRRLLQSRGMIPIVAEDGKKGVDTFLKSIPGEYSAILMDIRMPIMDGIEAAKAIRASSRPDAKHVPIIALSANVVLRERSEEDRRVVNIHLTPKGEKAYHHHAEFHKKMVEAILEHITEDEIPVDRKSVV